MEIEGVQLADRLRGRQARLLVAYLLLNRGRHIGREELSVALWPGDAPRSQDAALRTLLSRLRSALGAGKLAGREQLILDLPEPVWIDVEAAAAEVERAEGALRQGDSRGAWALAQVPLNIASRGLLPGAQAHWLESHRRDLEDVWLQALEVIGRAGLGLGGTQLASVERAARTLIEREPYRESGYVLLMEAHAARGNVAEGLRTFDRLRTLLRDELGTSPSPDALAVHERLLHPQPRVLAATAGGGASADARLELPSVLRARGEGPLVGRQRELAELSRLWAHARGLVLLTGDPGIGKTRLAAELARRVHEDGAYVLVGRASEELLVPYQPFLEALRHYFVNVSLPELRTTAQEYASELARLLPEIRRRVPDLPPSSPSEPETERYRLFEAVVGLLSEMSQTAPVLLVLDDLHWADRPTLLLLRHLTRAADPARLLILGTFRATEAATNGFIETMGDLRRERLATQLEVPGLGQADTAELVRTLTGESPSRAFTRVLHEETEGNPFFIEEIVRHLREAGVHAMHAGALELQQFGLPEGVKQVIARRLERLEERTIQLLRAAAVIGRDFDAALLEQIVALDVDDFLAALDEALATGLVVQSSDNRRYSFSHTLVRETLYEGMSTRRRERIHLRVGEALESSRRGSVASLALHFTRAAGAEDAEKAIAYARKAAEQASELLAHEESAEHYARALEVVERFEPQSAARRLELLLLLGEARVRAGERALAGRAFRDAAVLAEQLGDSAALARAAIGASRRYLQQPGVVDADLITMLERALANTAGERTLTRVHLLARMCGALYYSAERERMKELSEEATALAEQLEDPEARAVACAARRRTLWDAAHLKERLETSTEMLTRAREVGDVELELQAHAWLVVDLLEQGDRDAVDAQIEAFSVGAERLRQPLYVWNAILWRAMRALLAGHLDEADELAAEALAAGAPAEAVTAPQYYAVQLLAIRREQGRFGELEDAALQLVQANPARPAWRAALAALHSETGNRTAAAEQLEILARHDFADIPCDLDWMTAVTLLSDTCAVLGDAQRAAILYEQLLPYADANVVIGLAVVCLGPTTRYLGKLAATMGSHDRAAEHFERALAGSAALESPLWLAHTELDYAQALGLGEKAEGLIAQALNTAAELDLPAVARRAAELRRA